MYVFTRGYQIQKFKKNIVQNSWPIILQQYKFKDKLKTGSK